VTLAIYSVQYKESFPAETQIDIKIILSLSPIDKLINKDRMIPVSICLCWKASKETQ